jgi:hypothetical protein
MNCNAFTRRISRGALASAIAMTLGLTALAEDSPRLRTPRRAFDAKIDIRNANIADAGTPVNPPCQYS